MQQVMLGSTRGHSYLNFGTIFLSALLREKLYKKPFENSWSPTQQFMNQNNILTMLRERTSMWTTRSYFKNQFMDFFGSITKFLEFCGIYFACFLFSELIVDLMVMVSSHMEIHPLTDALLGFGKTFLIASYNLFLTSILTSVFNPQDPLLQALEPEPTRPAKVEDETRTPV